MPVSAGRNTRIENWFRQLTGFGTKVAPIETGQTAPTASYEFGFGSTRFSRSNTQFSEYQEFPIRDPHLARELIELRNHPEASTAIAYLAADCFSSEVGDDQGFKIGDLLADGSPVDPVTQAIGNALIDRIFRGPALNLMVEEQLIYGDCFRSILLNDQMDRITRIKILPTWEMFRIEDEDGVVQRFEQRRTAGADQAEKTIHPMICVHWRFRQKTKYGRSLFLASLENGDFDRLDRATMALDQAAISLGFNPNVHELPDGWTGDQCDAYRLDHENEKLKPGRLITDYYMQHTGKLTKVSNGNGSALKDLIDNVQMLRSRIAMAAQIPSWMMGLPASGATDIGGQPAMAYARTVNNIRSTFAEGVRQVIDLELIINEVPAKFRNYQIEFPKIHTNAVQQSIASTESMDGGGGDTSAATEFEEK
jgi:hypothetical protein